MSGEALRIVHYNLTTTTKEGGVETFVWELSRQQARQGHAVTIIGGAGSVARGIAGVKVLRYPFVDRMRWRQLPPLRRHFELTKLLERLSMLPAALPALWAARPTIVHLHKPYDFIVAPVAHALGAHVIYHGHGEDFYPGDRFLSRNVDALVSCSGYNARSLQQHYGVAPAVVFNGFDPAHFSPQPPDLTLRTTIAAPDERIVLVAGRMQPWKGIQYAIRALAQLSPDERVRLVIVGSGVYLGALKALAHELGQDGRITWVDTIPHRAIRQYYALADVVLGTSFASETFGMVLCEALACGRPVIASDWAGFNEVVLDGQTGWIVPREDPAALAVAIRTVLNDPTEARRRAARGHDHVHRLFTWGAVAERVAAVYAAVVERSTRSDVV